MWDGVITENQKLSSRWVSSHIYFTYIQASNKASRDQKPIKMHKSPIAKKNYRKNEKKITKIRTKGYMTYQRLHLNLIMLSSGLNEPQLTPDAHKIQNETHENTSQHNLTPKHKLNQNDNKTTRIYTVNTTNSEYVKNKNNKIQLRIKGMQRWSCH